MYTSLSISFLYLIFCVLSTNLYFHWLLSGRKLVQESQAKHILSNNSYLSTWTDKILLFRYFKIKKTSSSAFNRHGFISGFMAVFVSDWVFLFYCFIYFVLSFIVGIYRWWTKLVPSTQTCWITLQYWPGAQNKTLKCFKTDIYFLFWLYIAFQLYL